MFQGDTEIGKLTFCSRECMLQGDTEIGKLTPCLLECTLQGDSEIGKLKLWVHLYVRFKMIQR